MLIFIFMRIKIFHSLGTVLKKAVNDYALVMHVIS